ncbi:MAG: PspA/IM30 family protein [Acidimicrobiia bacterium]|nr:MAG: PspA/IM30 family protein [Acidimicrobiia bacterium]
MLSRIWAYIKALFITTAENAMDPKIEIEAAINTAKKQDQELRNQAAKVVAHRTQLESQIDKSADDSGEAREMAKQAILKAEEAKTAGDSEAVEKWTLAAQSIAMKLQAAENNLASLKDQFTVAQSQAEKAKDAVQQNAMKLQELSARRMELLGQLEQAKMQEAVNDAVASMSSSISDTGPSLDQVEAKIERRKAEAMARAELREATPEGAEAELRAAINVVQADAKLEELKAELGLGSAQAPASEPEAQPEPPAES